MDTGTAFLILGTGFVAGFICGIAVWREVYSAMTDWQIEQRDEEDGDKE